MKALILAAGVALLAFAGAGNSGHGCNGDVTDIGGVLYIDERAVGDVWIYLESNGAAGLQSGGPGTLAAVGDATGLISHYDAGCDHANPDTLLY